ncbi:MAG: beta-eliminating lyase-related protein [Myxococcota bacterium]
MFTPETRAAAFRDAPRRLRAHRPTNVRALLTALAAEADEPPDWYGAGGALEVFEAELAQRFDKPAAVFVPSGTLAQQVMLRIATERAGCPTLGFHPTCHLELHEHHGYSFVHGMRSRLVGQRHRALVRADLDAVREPLGALLLELPQREVGGELPPWHDLVAQVQWARERGVWAHLDGARVWEASAGYDRPLDEIAALFDSVYVSFYKVLGGIAGAALLSDADTIARARVWIGRLGGNLVSMYPMVLAARRGLRDQLPRVPGYLRRAKDVAEVLRGFAGVRVKPDPPHTNMMHVFFPAEPERLLDASAATALERGIALITAAVPTEVPGVCRAELVIGDASDDLTDQELREGFAALLARL